MYASGQTAFDVVCCAASFGGIAAYKSLLAGLPATFPAALVIVQHRAVFGGDPLAALLQRSSRLPVVPLVTGAPLAPGVVHVVPAGMAASLDASTASPLAQSVRGGADELFVAAAERYGPRALAVVLTGRLEDGALGVRHIRGAGGRVLVQAEDDCLASGMPRAALATGCVDFALPLSALADAVTALVMAPGAAGMMQVPLPAWARPITPPVAASA